MQNFIPIFNITDYSTRAAIEQIVNKQKITDERIVKVRAKQSRDNNI